MIKRLALLLFLVSYSINAQDYFLEKYKPFNKQIPSPEEFLGYDIGFQHTRHDMIVAYLRKLAEVSDRATIHEYGKTHGGRSLVILTVSNTNNINNLDAIKQAHLKFSDPSQKVSNYDEVPVFINLGYNVHGNEPSSSEAALLTAYTLVASNSSEIEKYLNDALVFIDPTINPDGRDRHTHWANMYKGIPLVADPQDAEHNEYWPGGRTNHYWFDLNRDWLLAVHPESRGKLNWYHNWYPNVVTDFHEMGARSTYFFEPMKPNASQDPIMPRENYENLNNLFAKEFKNTLDSIGSLYFTKEVFDGTYPGYGSSYPDLQGGLALLFEQASSRGHVQNTAHGKITFAFTIRNQFLSSITTVRAAVKNKAYLREYQQDFFKSALTNAVKSKVKGYTFYDHHDKNRVKAFIDKLLIHKIDVYKGRKTGEYYVPTKQPQYRMVQSVFETYKKFRDSVYYDASAWSVANFYNMKYKAVSGSVKQGSKITSTDDLINLSPVEKASYAYVVNSNDYNVPALMYYLLSNKVNMSSAFRPFSVATWAGPVSYNYGSLVIPVSKQSLSSEKLYEILKKGQNKFNVAIHGVSTGFSSSGIDLGSGNMRPVKMPKAAMLVGNGVSSYEAGEVWHLLDTKVNMPITKLPMRNFNRISLDKYNSLVMVSGSYSLTKSQIEKIKNWVNKGNTLIAIGSATKWAIDNKLVSEKLIEKKKDSSKTTVRKPYALAGEISGKERVGGAIFRAEIDNTHPLGFGYTDKTIPIYKNNSIWLAPSKNSYSTVAKFTDNPHIDGFITDKNLNTFLKPSATLVVSKVGRGRAVLFANNPNFRGSWFGTNRLFLNALFLGNHIGIPK